VFAAQVIRESLDRSTGFVHYLSSSSYASALDDCHEVEIKGRLAKSFPADDKRKLYCRNLPKGLSERDLRGEIESLGGSKCENLSLSNKGGRTNEHAQQRNRNRIRAHPPPRIPHTQTHTCR